ncbi:MAG: DDE-type integrase/transposase/recombinase [Mogibacterium sp.]|nr:DDE-type integrase/transposase/recombinase [Mogibacterium sp.]
MGCIIDQSAAAADIRKGAVLQSGTYKSRVFYCDIEWVFMIDLSTNRIERTGTSELFERLDSGEWAVIEGEISSRPYSLTQEEQEIVIRRELCIQDMLQKTYPYWDRLFVPGKSKPAIDEAVSRLGISRRQTGRLIIRYFLSACDRTSLLDQRKWNSRTRRAAAYAKAKEIAPESLKDVEYALRIFKATKSVQKAYDEMIKKYYYRYVSDENGNSVKRIIDEAPSYSRVYRYLGENLGGLSINDYRKGERDYYNNRRPLPGNAQYGIPTIGSTFELDEVELDCQIVSENSPSALIGKPVVYAAVDTKSDIVMAVKVGLKNNSYSGFCDLLMTLLEPHSVQAKTVGAMCDDNLYPSLVLPANIRCDHGSEYESKALEAACKELGIQVSFVRVATGSMKGLVEACHHSIQQHLRHQLSDAGFINKIPGGNSEPKIYDDARKKACLTLSDITKIFIEEVCFYNTEPRDTYEPDKEMLEAGLVLTPVNIWNFEKSRSLDPTNITDVNRRSCLFALMCRSGDKRRFTISRKGICYSGHSLKYFSDEDWFLDMLSADDKNTAEVRYMDNTVSAVWVRYRNEIHKVGLSEKREQNLTLADMNWEDYDNLYKELMQKTKEEKKIVKGAQYELEDRNAQTVRYAKSVQIGANETEGVRAARAEERRRIDQDPNETRNRMADPERPRFSDTPHEPTEEELLIAEIMEMTSDDEELYGYGQV